MWNDLHGSRRIQCRCCDVGVSKQANQRQAVTLQTCTVQPSTDPSSMAATLHKPRIQTIKHDAVQELYLAERCADAGTGCQSHCDHSAGRHTLFSRLPQILEAVRKEANGSQAAVDVRTHLQTDVDGLLCTNDA